MVGGRDSIALDLETVGPHWVPVAVRALCFAYLHGSCDALVCIYESPETASRAAKAKEVLSIMGASVLLGGLSTFLGVIPLMLSSSNIIFILSLLGHR